MVVLVFTSPLRAQEQEWSQEHYTKKEVLIPMRDGTRLFTTIYAPKNVSRTYPILLNRTPYGVEPYGRAIFRNSLGPSPQFAREGFIFVYQDVRGRYMSEGRFVDMTPHRDIKTGPGDIDESTDTFDTITWLLGHAPGNNGRVGQWGISYPGFYAAAGMIDAHPALMAVSPQAPIMDWFAGDDFHRNGALWLPHLFNFIARYGQSRPKPTTDTPKPFHYPTGNGYAFFEKLGTLTDVNKRYFHNQIPFWNEVMAHDTYDAFWKTRNLRPHLKGIRPAVLVVGGWFDAENLYGSLEVFKALSNQSPETPMNLVMGPWFHGAWETDPGESLGDVNFGSRTSDTFLKEVEFPFFMHHLKGAPDPKLPKALVFQTGANRWHRFEAWPPAGVRTTRLFFQPGRRLAFSSPSEEQGFEAFPSNPARPVPFLDVQDTGMPREYMTADQRFTSRRADVLTYETGPLDSDLVIAGPIRVHLCVNTTGTDADWVVKVIDVSPESAQVKGKGRVKTPKTGSELPGGYQQLVRGEVMRGKFRNSLEKPEPFVPGEPTVVEWSLNDIFHRFQKNHRLMVQVQSSWFPLMDRNPQVFTNIHTAKATDFHASVHHLYQSASFPSYLDLPVLDLDQGR